jgi:hypothetical protein
LPRTIPEKLTMQELLKALIAAKSEFTPIAKDKASPQFKSKYSSLNAVLEAVEPALLKHGLVIVHQVDDLEDKAVMITTLHHESGQKICTTMAMPSFTDAQKMGSWITYARRYSIICMLSVCSDEDDDGTKASQGPAATTKPPAAAQSKPKYQAQAIVEDSPVGDPLAILKRNVSQGFRNLAWSQEQMIAWGADHFGGRPSAQWVTEDWQKASRMLSALMDKGLEVKS